MPTTEPVTLRFAYAQTTVEWQTLFDRFHEKYPYITVEPIATQRPGVDLDTRLRAGGIDIFYADRGGLEYAGQGMVAPLDDIQLGDWSSIRDDYYKGAWEGLAIGGQCKGA